MPTKIKNDPNQYLSRATLTRQCDQKTTSVQSSTKGEQNFDRLEIGKLDNNWYLDINLRYTEK